MGRRSKADARSFAKGQLMRYTCPKCGQRIGRAVHPSKPGMGAMGRTLLPIFRRAFTFRFHCPVCVKDFALSEMPKGTLRNALLGSLVPLAIAAAILAPVIFYLLLGVLYLLLVLLVTLSGVPPIQLGVAFLLTVWGVSRFRRSGTSVAIAAAVGVIETLILLAWITAKTAAAVWNYHAFDTATRVIPPTVENRLMPMFWVMILVGVFAVGITAIMRRKKMNGRRITVIAPLWVILQLLLFSAMLLNLNEFLHRSDKCYSNAEGKYTRGIMTLPGDR